MNKPILITGASGFMGFHVARALRAHELPYRALVRPTSDVRALVALGAELCTGDVTRPETLVPALEGCAAVIHLAGAADIADPLINRQVNVDGTVNVAAACGRAGVPRMVFYSTNCAVRELQDAYGETKWQAEQAMAEFGDLDLRTFRPAMIYGEGSVEFTTFVNTVARAPLVPVPGSGEHILRPAFVDDVVAATLAAVQRDGLNGRVYDIIGSSAITLNALIEQVARLMGKKRWPLHLPLKLCFWGAQLLGMLQTHPVVTPDQVLAFAQDTDGDWQDAARDLDYAPVTMEQGLELLFGRTPWHCMGQLM